jgi:hypothetical protein
MYGWRCGSVIIVTLSAAEEVENHRSATGSPALDVIGSES